MKISNCILLDDNFDNNINASNNDNVKSNNKKYVLLKNDSQKSKLQKLVSLVLNKLNSDTVEELRTFLDESNSKKLKS